MKVERVAFRIRFKHFTKIEKKFTACYIEERSSPTRVWRTASIGYAYVSRKDQFRKDVGRVISFFRAVASLPMEYSSARTPLIQKREVDCPRDTTVLVPSFNWIPGVPNKEVIPNE